MWRINVAIGTLPSRLNEAIQTAKGSDLLREALGAHVFTSVIENSQIEWDDYRRHITDYELKRYLPTL